MLISQIYENFPRTKLTPQNSHFFNETKGLRVYKEIVYKEHFENLDAKYLCLASLNALYEFYLDNNAYDNTHDLDQKLISQKYVQSEDFMMIDSTTVQDLELVLNLKDYKAEGSVSSFFKCQTYGGYRLLRANILQPFKDKKTIVERQNLVRLLNDNNEFSFILQKCLSALKRTDNITVKLMQKPKEDASSILFFYNLVQDVYFMLKKIVSLCNVFEKMLEKNNEENQSIKKVSENQELIEKLTRDLKKNKASKMIKLFEENFNLTEIEKQKQSLLLKPKAAKNKPNNAKKNMNNMANNIEFAEYDLLDKSNVRNKEMIYFIAKEKSSLTVDLARLSYSRIMENIFEIYEDIKRSTKIRDLKLLNNTNRGYHLKIPQKSANRINITDLKAMIKDTVIHADKKKGGLLFNTVSLYSLSLQLNDCGEGIMLETFKIVDKCLSMLQKDMSYFFKLNDMVSELDICQSFSLYSKKLKTFCFPKIQTEDEAIIAEECYNPQLLHSLTKYSDFSLLTANNYFMSDMNSLHVMLGGSSSGKTSYIKGLATTLVLAQIGCPVPCKNLIFKPMDRILTKIHSNDNLETLSSAFDYELCQLKRIKVGLEKSNGTSLILLDNIGTTTSDTEGFGMAIAFMNELLQCQNKFIFFTSTNIEFKRMKNIFKGCQLLTISNKKRLSKVPTGNKKSNKKNFESNFKDTQADEFQPEEAYEITEQIEPYIACDIHKTSTIDENIEESLKFANFDHDFISNLTSHKETLNKFYNDDNEVIIEDGYFQKLNDIYREYIKIRNSDLDKITVEDLKKQITEKYFK